MCASEASKPAAVVLHLGFWFLQLTGCLVLLAKEQANTHDDEHIPASSVIDPLFCMQMAEMHEGRGSLFTAMQGYLLWAVGGRNKFAFHDSTECYHPAQDVWLAGPQMSRKRFAAAGGVLNNAVYVTGGFDGQSYTNSCEKLDAREGKWSLVSYWATCHCMSLFAACLLLICLWYVCY